MFFLLSKASGVVVVVRVSIPAKRKVRSQQLREEQHWSPLLSQLMAGEQLAGTLEDLEDGDEPPSECTYTALYTSCFFSPSFHADTVVDLIPLSLPLLAASSPSLRKRTGFFFLSRPLESCGSLRCTEANLEQRRWFSGARASLQLGFLCSEMSFRFFVYLTTLTTRIDLRGA